MSEGILDYWSSSKYFEVISSSKESSLQPKTFQNTTLLSYMLLKFGYASRETTLTTNFLPIHTQIFTICNDSFQNLRTHAFSIV